MWNVGEEKRGCGWETGKERECGVRGRDTQVQEEGGELNG